MQGKYLIGKVLGQGGFGITYLAWDLTLDLKLAIKEFFPMGLVARTSGNPKVDIYLGNQKEQFNFGKERFLSEAKTLARFSEHPNIVTVRDFFQTNNTAYMVMNYIEGKTLEEYLNSAGGKISFPKMLEIMMPVMDSLREVHQNGFMHRDVSPDNIYIRNDGRIILIDFGAARQDLQSKSRSFSVIMKVGYSPEEQYRSRGEQGPWTDIYSIAATMYRGITGKLPPESMDRLESDNLIPPSQLDVDITVSQEQALLKAFAVRGRDRFHSIEDFQTALLEEQVSVKKVISHVPVAEPEPSLKVDEQYLQNKQENKIDSTTFPLQVSKQLSKLKKLTGIYRKNNPKREKSIIAIISAIIFLTAGSAAAYYYVPIYEISIEPKYMKLVAGEEGSHFAVNIKPFFANSGRIEWDIDEDNKDIAKLIEGYYVKPLKAGTRTIKIRTTDGRLMSSFLIEVVNPTISWQGGTYTGKIQDGVPHGEGEWNHPYGEKYIGRWSNGKYSGSGTWMHPSGEKYEGFWSDGLFHGAGVWWGPNGDSFDGSFREGKWHGRGTYTDGNGKTEMWYWENGKKITNYISSIGAVVKNLKFFESTYEHKPTYGSRFLQSQARYIGWSLDFELTPSSKDRYVSITTKYYRSDGSLYQEHTDSFKFEKNDTFTTWSQWWGYTSPGNWNKGKYRIDIIAEGRVVASRSFEIY